MPRKKRDSIPRLDIPENAPLRQIYAKYREEFTAADLQQFTEEWKGVPVEQIIVGMERIQRGKSPKRRKKA